MKRWGWALWLASALSALSLWPVDGAQTGTAVQKVLQMLEEMKVKGAAAMAEEEGQHKEYQAFCASTLAEKRKAVSDGADRAQRLRAEIGKFEASISTLGSELEVHDKEISTAEKDAADSKALREQEEQDFTATQKEYEESVAAMGKAVDLLKAQAGAGSALPQLAALLESKAVARKAAATSALRRFLAPGKEVYDFQSQGILEMLEKLKAKFLEEKAELEAAEEDKKKSHTLVMASLKQQKATAQEAKEDKTQFKSKAAEDLANAKADLQETEATLSEDTKYENDLARECKTKASEYAKTSALRAEEQAAVSKALEIIGGEKVAGASLVQLQAGTSLAWLRASPASASAPAPAQLEAALRALDASPELNLALKRARKEGPDMAGVKEVLQKYLTTLESEQAAEIEHQAFCQRELGSNNRTRQHKSAAVESLTAEIDQLDASLAQLSEEIASISAQVTELSGALAEALRLRQAEQEKHKATLQEAQEAQKAVAEALGLLQDVFSKSSLLQLNQSTAKGGASSGSPVLGLLEALLGDFSRLEAETSAAEAESRAEFKAFSADSKTDMASKQSDAAHLEEKKEQQAKALAQKQADLASSQSELGSATGYFEELKKQCISPEADAAKAEAHRQEEIAKLKTALKELE
ncbi:unnamed protein product [Effrenium voratum]|nr:unnamed protein product [Effrenium voratum]